MSKAQTQTNKERRKLLFVGGLLSVALGLVLIIIGIGYFILTFFSIIGSRFDPISWQFLCAFVGWFFLLAGSIMCLCGYVPKRNTKIEKPSA
jgi:ABC-type antimicrobial peptide transport system permease subunit